MSTRRSPTRTPSRLILSALAVTAAVAVTLAPTALPGARAASIGQLQQQISAGQSQISNLAGAVGAASSRIGQLNNSIASLQAQLSRIQSELNAKRAELLRLRGELTAARTRLAALEAFQAHAERVLSSQLINAYESDQPDIVSVVLEARGFSDLLERLSFASRIRKQDVHVVSRVRAARAAVAAQATRLGALELRQQTLTTQVLAQRNSLARVRLGLVTQELAAAQQRSRASGKLAGARGQVASLQNQLNQLQAAQAAAAARAAAASAQAAGFPIASGSTGTVGAGQVSSGGGFVFPLPKGSAPPPGTWSEDDGVDMPAPGDTSELAVCSGTIVLHGIGGFGPWAPVLHCDSPVGGYDYVYYGHAGPLNQLAVGTHVGAGQVMSSIGPGIVGISTGPHLEIGFADSSGTPIGPGSAGTMYSLLQGSYG
ncbi:MAG: murein hydrolase activator EnvC family protein [Solirubrobacteraceae bacterium]